MSSVYSTEKNSKNKASYAKGIALGTVSALSLLAAGSQIANADTITVKAGDTVWDFAQKYGVSVSDIENANSDKIVKASSTIDLIYAGQQLEISANSSAATSTAPASTESTSAATATTDTTATSSASASSQYVVQNGDTLSSIAARQGVSVAALAQANGISDANLITAGQVLTIPSADYVVSATPAQSATADSSVAADSSATASSAVESSTTAAVDSSTSSVAASSAAASSAVAESSTADSASSATTVTRIAGESVTADEFYNNESSAAASSAPAASSSTTAAQSASSSTTPAASSSADTSSTAASSSTAATTTNDTTTTTSSSSDLTSGSVVSLAVKLASANIPYVYGGSTLSGMDCSGLTSYVYQHAAGITLPHNTVAQEAYVSKHSVSEAQPGDILFWGSAGATYHCAIYIGNNQYVAAPDSGQNVQIQTISSYFMPSFAGTVN